MLLRDMPTFISLGNLHITLQDTVNSLIVEMYREISWDKFIAIIILDSNDTVAAVIHTFGILGPVTNMD